MSLRLSPVLILVLAALGFGVLAIAEEPNAPARDQILAALPVRTIRFDEMTFTDPAVKKLLAAVEAKARGAAAPGWQHVPWHWRGATGQTPERNFIFATQWGSRPSGKWHCVCSADQAPCHLIDLVAYPRQMEVGKPKEIYSLHLSTHYYPKEKGWGGTVSYGIGYLDGRWQNEYVYLALGQGAWPAKTLQRDMELPLRGFGTTKRYGNVEYIIVAGPAENSWPRDSARAYLRSAESFRAAGLAAIQEIEKVGAAQIASGEAIKSVSDHSLLVVEKVSPNPDPRRGPPERVRPAEFKPPVPAKYELGDDHKQEILGEMRADLAGQRKLFEESYQEMFEAVEKAFPFAGLLPPKE